MASESPIILLVVPWSNQTLCNSGLYEFQFLIAWLARSDPSNKFVVVVKKVGQICSNFVFHRVLSLFENHNNLYHNESEQVQTCLRIIWIITIHIILILINLCLRIISNCAKCTYHNLIDFLKCIICTLCSVNDVTEGSTQDLSGLKEHLSLFEP